MELDTKGIGNRIRTIRKGLNLTQLEIKAKTGISSGNLSDIERGNRLPAAATLVELSRILGCSIDFILMGTPPTGTPKISELGESAQRLLNLFYVLSDEDQEELIMIAQIKANKKKKTETN